MSSVPTSIVAAAVAGPLVLLLTRRISVAGGEDEDLTPALPAGGAPMPQVQPQPDEGPVMVTVEYQIDPARAADFAEVMKESRRARLRQGVLSWGLFRDPLQAGRYIEYYLDESWLEHLRRQERFTAADIGLRERRLAFHLGAEAPKVVRYIGDPLDD
jgi:hypothetical protein